MGSNGRKWTQMMSGLKNLDQGRWFFCTVNLFFLDIHTVHYGFENLTKKSTYNIQGFP